MLEMIRERYRRIVFKSMNAFLTDSEQSFYNDVTKKFYGGCRCPEAHIPTKYVMKSLCKRHNITLAK